MRRHLSTIVLIASAAVLVVGVIDLFTLRFQAGDVYPEYSTLRSDPLGTMALYESLEKLDGFSVNRDFSATNQLPRAPQTTYMTLAMSLYEAREMSEGVLAEIQQYVSGGGRMVITLFPFETEPFRLPQPGEKPQKPEARPLKKWWGVEYEIVPLKRDRNEYQPATAKKVGDLPIPAELDWYSGILFKNLSSEWAPVYERDGKPVLIQRTFGRGSIVIATDSYFVSNEAMLRDRHADLLAFMIGANRNIVFDEAHLGTTEAPGVATLIRKYRLHGFIASLILIAALFIWKMSIPLVPPYASEGETKYVAGKGVGLGIVNLLKRSIPATDLLQTCLNEWKKTSPQQSRRTNERIKQIDATYAAEQSLPAKQRNPVTAYRTIAQILQKRTS
jgi:hypothetical protein